MGNRRHGDAKTRIAGTDQKWIICSEKRERGKNKSTGHREMQA